MADIQQVAKATLGYALPPTVRITRRGNDTVSYTHLTLPTICSV